MSQRAKLFAAVLAICAITASCGQHSDKHSDANSLNVALRNSAFTAKDNLVLMDCASATNRQTIKLTALSSTTGQKVATRETPMPAGADFKYHCDASPSSQLRQLFNRNFTAMALLAVDPRTHATTAATIDLASSRVEPASPSTAADFSPTAVQAPFFPAGSDTLWYIDETKSRVRSKDANQATPVDRGAIRNDQTLFVVQGQPRSAGVPQDAVINAAGTRIAVLTTEGIRLAALGGGTATAPLIDLMPGGSAQKGHTASHCLPTLWIDEHRLLSQCAEQISVDTFSADFHTVINTQLLLPKSEHRINSVVVSPDHTSIAFVATQGTQRSIFIESLTPGGTPRKVADLEGSNALVQWS